MKDEDYNLIETFLDGSLQEQALIAFKTRLNNEPALQEALATRQGMEHYLEIKDKKIDFRQKIEGISGNYFKQEEEVKPTPRILPLRWMAIAAGLAIIIASLWWLNQEGTINNLYSQHITTYNLSLAERGDNKLDLQALQTAYNQQRFDDAIPMLEVYTKENPEDLSAILALGVAQLHTDDVINAQDNLTKVHLSKGILTYDAAWYLALLSIKKEAYNQAKPLLLSIPKGAKYFDKAQFLLEKIK